MMFGTGQAIREKLSNIFMDYRNETEITVDVRWNDRITYDGTWENNLFNFFSKVTPKLTEDLRMMPSWLLKLQEMEAQIVDKLKASPEQLKEIQQSLGEAIENISIPKTEGMEAAIVAFAKSISVMPAVQYESICWQYS